MTIKQKAADLRQGQAAYQNVRIGQPKNTTRRAVLVSFILPIDDRYRLTADERCWRIEQCRKNGEWRPVEYHATIEGTVNSLARRLVRTSEVQSLADALAAVENVSRTLTQALAPCFKVTRR